MTITAFNRAESQTVIDEINAAFKLIADRHGIDLRLGRMTMSGSELTGSIKAKVLEITGDGTACTLGAKRLAEARGLRADNPNLKNYAIVDYNSRAHRMPWIVQELHTGKRYKITDNHAAMLFTPKADNRAPPVMKPHTNAGNYAASF
jgi:hypothetical protein